MCLAVSLSSAKAQSIPSEDPILLALKARLEQDLVGLDSSPTVNFDYGTLISKFKTRNFIIHPIDKTGRISLDTVEREGPGEDGFLIRASIEPLGAIHQAVMPSGGRDIYWNYYLNIYPVKNTRKQLFLSFQFGSRLKKSVIEDIKEIAEQSARPDGE